MDGVTWTYFWYISLSTTSLQPLNHLTLTEYIAMCSHSFDLKNLQFSFHSITLIFSLFKPVNMRSRNFRNGVIWPYTTEYKAYSSCSILVALVGQMNYIAALNIRQNDFPAT